MTHCSALAQRDPEFIRAHLEHMRRAILDYHEVSVSGMGELAPGPALIVGNHNGGMMAPDMFALMATYWSHFGADDPAYGLMHDFVFQIPVVGATMAKLGAVPACPAHAVELLGRGAKVLVYPGGDIDAFKPYTRRHEIVFGARTGFVRIALRTGAPIVPVVSIGAHEGFRVLSDGAELARRSGWKHLTRIEVFPLVLSFPWGLSFGPLALYAPMPVRMKLRVLPPIRWPDLSPAAAGDPAVVRRCCEQVRGTMQSALDGMVREGGFGRKPLPSVLRSIGLWPGLISPPRAAPAPRGCAPA